MCDFQIDAKSSRQPKYLKFLFLISKPVLMAVHQIGQHRTHLCISHIWSLDTADHFQIEVRVNGQPTLSILDHKQSTFR
jgi:hypothetical protein